MLHLSSQNNMRTLLLGFFFLFFHTSHAQPKMIKLDAAKLPKSLSYNGQLKNAVSWRDSSGLHYVLQTETGGIPAKSDPDNQDAALYAYHYLAGKDSVRLLWRVYDFVKDCPVDIEASFVKNTLAVTDLDKNGAAEIWLLYRTACRGDVSPGEMKIVMYENGKKYAARGTTKVRVSEKEYDGGRYEPDQAFKSGIQVFKAYAQKLWDKHVRETWE